MFIDPFMVGSDGIKIGTRALSSPVKFNIGLLNSLFYLDKKASQKIRNKVFKFV